MSANMALVVRSLYPYSKCCFHTCSANLVNSKLPQVMRKFLRESATKKKWYPGLTSQRALPSPTALANTKNEHGKNSNRRVTSLNKLFMRHITDQMSCGEIAAKIYGRNVEISKVKIAPDFHIVNIYWLAKGSIDDSATENILKEISVMLRHELSQLKIIGVVPRLQFVKDKSNAKIMEMETQLAKADFGDDFIPTDRSYPLKSDFILKTQLEPHLVEKIQKIDINEISPEIPIPPISDNIYGLDRSAILDRILNSKNKTTQAWKGEWKIDSNLNTLGGTKIVNGDVHLSPIAEKDQFREFLRKRQIAEMKAIRRSTKLATISEYEDETNHDEIENSLSYEYVDEEVFDEYTEKFEQSK